jgi:hypothetical protein
MNSRIRCFLFQWYWALAPLVGLVAIVILFIAEVEKRWEISAAAAGIAAGLVYFVQKQKLEEIRLFHDLFAEFNERYRDLHEDLQRVSQRSPDSLREVDEGEILDQYFNLCAEEYLFYKQGRILRHVWQTWCRGILIYLRVGHIEDYWRAQESANFHYGFTVAEIELTAGENLR